MKVAPITLKAARKFVGELHRHNRPPQGGLFAVSVRDGERVAGVAIVGRPVARMLDDGRTVEITRTCTDGTKNANSMLYGAACRTAAAMGYERAITYTLAEEPGVSLRAAGFEVDAHVKAEDSWSRPSRARTQADLFGHKRPQGAKVRWRRRLAGARDAQEPKR